MSIVSNNLKYLRRLNGLTQEQFAKRIGIKRSLLGAYEEARANPNLDNLLMIAKVFGVSTDQMLKNDLRKVRETPSLTTQVSGSTLLKTNPEPDISEKESEEINLLTEPKPLAAVIEKYFQPELPIQQVAQKITPKPIITEEPASPQILPAESPKPSVNPNSFAQVQWVSKQLIPAYLSQFQQADFLNRLSTFTLPTLPAGNYRAFEASDDFAYPGSLLIGTKVTDWYQVQNARHYLLITRSHGLLYRRVYNQLKIKGTFLLSSDLEYITSSELTMKDVLEVWEIKAFLSSQLPNPTLSLHRINQLVEELQHELERVKKV